MVFCFPFCRSMLKNMCLFFFLRWYNPAKFQPSILDFECSTFYKKMQWSLDIICNRDAYPKNAVICICLLISFCSCRVLSCHDKFIYHTWFFFNLSAGVFWVWKGELWKADLSHRSTTEWSSTSGSEIFSAQDLQEEQVEHGWKIRPILASRGLFWFLASCWDV